MRKELLVKGLRVLMTILSYLIPFILDQMNEKDRKKEDYKHMEELVDLKFEEMKKNAIPTNFTIEEG